MTILNKNGKWAFRKKHRNFGTAFLYTRDLSRLSVKYRWNNLHQHNWRAFVQKSAITHVISVRSPVSNGLTRHYKMTMSTLRYIALHDRPVERRASIVASYIACSDEASCSPLYRTWNMISRDKITVPLLKFVANGKYANVNRNKLKRGCSSRILPIIRDFRTDQTGMSHTSPLLPRK